MAEITEDLPPNYFKLWRVLFKNAEISSQLALVRDELEERDHQIAGMVGRGTAQKVVRQAYTSGQLKGKKELEERLVFPWPPEKTKLISELLASFMVSFSSRAKGGRKSHRAKNPWKATKRTSGFLSRS